MPCCLSHTKCCAETRGSLTYRGNSRVASRQQHCLPCRQCAGSVLGVTGLQPGHQEMWKGHNPVLQGLPSTRKDSSSSLLLPFCAVLRAPMLSHCPSPLGHLCQLLIFLQSSCVSVLSLQLNYIYSLEARDNILCLFRSS